MELSQHYFLGFMVLLMSCLLEVSSRALHTESLTPKTLEEQKDNNNQTVQTNNSKDSGNTADLTDEILLKIKELNEKLTKSHLYKNNLIKDPVTIQQIDEDRLNKTSHLILTGKLQPFLTQKSEVSNSIAYDKSDTNDISYQNSRALQEVQDDLIYQKQGPYTSMLPLPYVLNFPLLMLPPRNILYEEQLLNPNFLSANLKAETRQKPPPLPFNIPWPLASIFPIFIKDPLLAYLSGGGWSNLIEYGQSADVCARSHQFNNVYSKFIRNRRRKRALKKRTVEHTTSIQDIKIAKPTKKAIVSKVTTRKPVTIDQSSMKNDEEGDLRFPFGDFTWFGNKKPVAPSPGFFINRLRVKHGGVAIAGPGGVATAGKGGTAIVGPGGLAYTKPGGVAIAGPDAKVVALSSDADLSEIVSRLQETQTVTARSLTQLLETVPEGKIVALGPVVYYHPNDK